MGFGCVKVELLGGAISGRLSRSLTVAGQVNAARTQALEMVEVKNGRILEARMCAGQSIGLAVVPAKPPA
jgi:hypothetical protein